MNGAVGRSTGGGSETHMMQGSGPGPGNGRKPGGYSRAEIERSRRVRRKLLRAGSFCLLVILAFCAVVAWQREVRNITTLERLVHQKFVAPLQEEIDRRGTLPLAHPRTDEDGNIDGPCEYLDAESIRVLRRAEEPVIVGSTSLITRIFQHNGFFVTVYDRGRVRVEWLTVDEFRKRILAQTGRVEERLRSDQAAPPDLP